MIEKHQGAGGEGRKGRFNVVDLLLVVAFVTIIAFVILVVSPFSFGFFEEDSVDVTLSYSVCLSGVDATYVNRITVGDTVLDATTKRPLGRVIAVDNRKLHTVFRYDEKTGGSMMSIPYSYDVVITILADATFETAVGYTVEQKRIAVGAEYTLVFPDFAGNGYCISVHEME